LQATGLGLKSLVVGTSEAVEPGEGDHGFGDLGPLLVNPLTNAAIA
jgi:hypothetical protein